MRKTVAVLLLAGSLLLIASGAFGASFAPSTARLAIGPYFDVAAFMVGTKLGWDKELNLNLELIWMPAIPQMVTALKGGSIDAFGGCTQCGYPYYSSFPELVNYFFTNQFMGFQLLGRKGKFKSFDTFLKELGDPEKARKATLAQIKGSTWPTQVAVFEGLINSVLEQAGLTKQDITIINMQSDEKAALAMIGGTGDFYVGPIPAELNLLVHHADKFEAIGGQEILGPGALFYSTMHSRSDWLAKNGDAALKLMAMTYRFNRWLPELRAKFFPIIRDAMNAHSGVGIQDAEMTYTFDKLLAFRPYQAEKDTTFAPGSIVYWRKSGKYFADHSENIPKDDPDWWLKQNPVEQWYTKLLARQDLLSWIDTRPSN